MSCSEPKVSPQLLTPPFLLSTLRNQDMHTHTPLSPSLSQKKQVTLLAGGATESGVKRTHYLQPPTSSCHSDISGPRLRISWQDSGSKPSGLGKEGGQQTATLYTHPVHSWALYPTEKVVAEWVHRQAAHSGTLFIVGIKEQWEESSGMLLIGTTWLMLIYPCVEPWLMSVLPTLAECHKWWKKKCVYVVGGVGFGSVFLFQAMQGWTGRVVAINPNQKKQESSSTLV